MLLVLLHLVLVLLEVLHALLLLVLLRRRANLHPGYIFLYGIFGKPPTNQPGSWPTNQPGDQRDIQPASQPQASLRTRRHTGSHPGRQPSSLAASEAAGEATCHAAPSREPKTIIEDDSYVIHFTTMLEFRTQKQKIATWVIDSSLVGMEPAVPVQLVLLLRLLRFICVSLSSIFTFVHFHLCSFSPLSIFTFVHFHLS
jgi:hypothetical protein